MRVITCLYHLLLSIVLSGNQAQLTDKPSVVMREMLAVGISFDVSTSVTLSGRRSEAIQAIQKTENSAIRAAWASRYREKIVEVTADQRVSACVRRYLTASLERGTGESIRPTTLRPAAQRVVVRRDEGHSTIFSPDGPLTPPELDLLRAESFTPALLGLLPAKAVAVGDQWQATTEAAAELTGIDPIQSGALNCTLREVKSSADGAVVRVALSGTLSGPSEQGPSRQSVEGHFLFDLDHRLISYLVLNGQSEIFDEHGKLAQRLDGRFELTRKPSIEDPRLSSAALEGVNLKPTADSTKLLFEQTDLAVRFCFPRNWELTSIPKNVIQLDEPTGGRLLVTVDPKPAPTAAKLRADLLAWLQSQKATVTAAGAVQPAPNSGSRRVDRFRVTAIVGEKEREWSYLVIRDDDRVATLAANLFARRSADLTKDVEAIARSLEFRPKLK